jgi:hypothetical protein
MYIGMYIFLIIGTNVYFLFNEKCFKIAYYKNWLIVIGATCTISICMTSVTVNLHSNITIVKN